MILLRRLHGRANPLQSSTLQVQIGFRCRPGSDRFTDPRFKGLRIDAGDDLASLNRIIEINQ
jgi:hypothetical protein